MPTVFLACLTLFLADDPALRSFDQDQEVSRPVGGGSEPGEAAGPDKEWLEVLGRHHKALHSHGTDAAQRQTAAEIALGAVKDPRAVQAIWQVFGGEAGHHLLAARMLGRIETPQSTLMLTALAVYSPSEKARHAATEPLRGRDPAEVAEPLIGLFQEPLQYWIGPIPGQRGARALFIEGERANYEFLYYSPVRPGTVDPFSTLGGVANPLYPSGAPVSRKMAQAFNKNQSKIARAAVDEQLQSDLDAINRLNLQINAINERVAGILRAVSGKTFRTAREPWLRWLARRLDYEYVPEAEPPRPTFAQVVPPLFRPTFVPVPPPSCSR